MLKKIKNIISKAVKPEKEPRPPTIEEALAMIFNDIKEAHEKLDKAKK